MVGGGCLAAHCESWAKILQDPWIVQVLRVGYQIPFKGELLSLSPVPVPSYHPDSTQYKALVEEVYKMRQKGAIEEAPLH